MLNSVNSSRHFLFSIEKDPQSEHPNQAAALQAFQADDWDTFEALTFGDHSAIPLNKVPFANGQNCLHVAIQSGRWSIALQLAKRSDDWVRDLVNQRDSYAHTPLTLLVEADTEHPELVDALINAGTDYSLSNALEAAATRGHVLTAKRLLETNIDAAEVPADLLRFGPSDRETVKAAELLISLGVDVTDALNHVMLNHPHSRLSALLLLGMPSDTALRMLLLLGASGPRALAETALRDEARDLGRAIESGVDVPATLRFLAKLPPTNTHAKAITLLIAEDERVLSDNTYVAKPASFTTTLLQLAKTREISHIPTLCAAADPKHMALGTSGPKALASLLDSGIQTEAAGRLIKWGVDIHLARLYAVDTRSMREWGADLDLTRTHSIEFGGFIKWATREQLDLLGADLAIALIYTLDQNDIDTARKIIVIDPKAGPKALWNVIEDKTLTYGVKTARLQQLLALKINANEALEKLASMNRIEDLRHLIGLGVPTAELLLSLTHQHQHSAAEKLIMAGADFGTAITDLHASHDADAAMRLTMALTKARDNVIAARAHLFPV